MPCCPSRALFASECSALVTFKGVCCQMHMIVLFCGLWDRHFQNQGMNLA
jgi:hypothetical protein